MRWRLARPSSLIGLLALGCKPDPIPAAENVTGGTGAPELRDSGGAGAGAGLGLGAGQPSVARPDRDPFAGIEALRPTPWTGWPLENLDLATEAGWRVDPVSGGFVLEEGLIFATDPGAFVLAIAPGELLEVGPASEGGVELVIAHGDGIESHYSPIDDPLVHAGVAVSRGAAIGLAEASTLRLVVTVDGVAIDPLLVLRQPLHRWPGLLRERPTPPAPPGAPLPG